MKRTFRSLLQETSQLQKGYLQVRMTTWWDGTTLLFEGTIARRGELHQDFNRSDGSFHMCLPTTRAKALRHAVRLHDAFLVQAHALPPVDKKRECSRYQNECVDDETDECLNRSWRPTEGEP